MIVIADTSPLHYLILVGAADVLPRLFRRVMIPDEVCMELRHPAAPPEVQHWISRPPPWLEIRSVPEQEGEGVLDLDVGEAAAIRLAQHHGGSAFLLMDDMKGRREAARRGIPTTGTLGVLRAASRKGELRLSDVLPRLLQTNFYVTEELVAALLAEERARTGGSD